MKHDEDPPAFVLRPIPPFRLDFTVWALRRRPRNQIDRWDGTTYRRVIVVDGHVIDLAVSQQGSATSPRLIVTANPPPRTPLERRRIRLVIERLLGLRIDLAGWYRIAASDARLGPLAHAFYGMKPVRFPTVFETVVNAFACQQLSLEVGLELLNRLAALCSAEGVTTGGVHPAFPTASDVGRLRETELRAIGLSRQKVRALLDLAQAITDRDLNLEALVLLDDDLVRKQLMGLRGVGRWTTEYVLLRGLGRLHVFPGDDVGAQKRLTRWLGHPGLLDYAGVGRAVARWQPYAGLIYFHLLLDGLSQTGALQPTERDERAAVRRTLQGLRGSARGDRRAKSASHGSAGLDVAILAGFPSGAMITTTRRR